MHFLPLQLPYEHRPYLRDESIDRLEDLRREVRHVVHQRFPLQDKPSSERAAAAKRRRLQRKSEFETLTFVVEYCTAKVPTAKEVRELHELARARLSTARRFDGGYELFYTRRREWLEFASRFDRFREAGTSKGHGSKQPDYMVFGYLVSQLTDDQIRTMVLDACRRVPELKEVIPWPAPSPSSPLQS